MLSRLKFFWLFWGIIRFGLPARTRETSRDGEGREVCFILLKSFFPLKAKTVWLFSTCVCVCVLSWQNKYFERCTDVMYLCTYFFMITGWMDWLTHERCTMSILHMIQPLVFIQLQQQGGLNVTWESSTEIQVKNPKFTSTNLVAIYFNIKAPSKKSRIPLYEHNSSVHISCTRCSRAVDRIEHDAATAC